MRRSHQRLTRGIAERRRLLLREFVEAKAWERARLDEEFPAEMRQIAADFRDAETRPK